MNDTRKYYENKLRNLLPDDVFFHSLRVAVLSEKLSEAIGIDSEECQKIYVAALHHDVGKQIIDSPVWNKKGNITREEFEVVKEHPVKSAEYMQHSDDDYLSPLSIYVRHHHERYDGSGYPMGLKGNSIPFYSRIIAICDALDAMTSKRPYREFAYTHERALEMLINKSGKDHDPMVVGVLEENWDKGFSGSGAVHRLHVENKFAI